MWKWLSILLLTLLLLVSCETNNKAYRVGVDPSWYPLNLMGKEPNVFAFTEDLLRAISAEEGVSFERVSMSWDNLTKGLKEKQYDGMLSSISPRVFIQRVYDFSDPFLRTGPVLVVKEDANESLLGDLSGKEIAVDSLQTEALLIDLYPGVTVHYYDSIPNGLDDVIAESIDGALIHYLPASNFIRDLYYGKVKIASPPLSELGLRLLTLHGENQELIEVFNRGIAKMQDNGTYEKLLKKWDLN